MDFDTLRDIFAVSVALWTLVIIARIIPWLIVAPARFRA